MKKFLLSILIFTCISASLLTGCASTKDLSIETAFPSKNINGVVQWGAGGGTDSLVRPLSALAEKNLGISIVVQNMAGGTGSIATQYIFDAPTDGYNLLMGAENPSMYKELGISELTYDDFDCVFLIGDETVGIVVGSDSRFKTFTEIVEAAKVDPSKIKLSTTGKGGLPWTVAAYITDVTGATFNQIPYDSDAAARMAVLNGECDFTVAKIQAGIGDYKAGTLKFLSMLSKEKVEALPEVSLVVDEYPAFDEYLPWGSFYGVFVKKGTDAAVTQKLGTAFKEASLDKSYTEILKNFNVNYLGLTGDEAKSYISTWKKNTVDALKKSGALK